MITEDKVIEYVNNIQLVVLVLATQMVQYLYLDVSLLMKSIN